MRPLLVTLALAFLLLSACGSDGATVDSAGDGDGGAVADDAAFPADGEYRSVEATEGGEPRPLVDGTVVALRLDSGDLGASAGCNQMGATYTVDGGVLIVGELSTTEMGCDPPRHGQDQWLADLLTARPTVTASADGFTLTSDDGGTTIRFVERSVAEPDVALVGTEWEVTGFIDGDVAMSGNAGEPGVVQFTDDGFVGGFDGCNRLGYDPAGDGLRYAVAGDTLTFEGNAVSTLVACDDTVEYQQRYRAVLAGEVTWSIEGDRLTLMAADGRGATYRGINAP